MKTVSPTLAALINSGVFQYAHIYTITLFGSLGGTSVLRLTDSQIDVLGGNTPSSITLSGLLAHYPFNDATWQDTSGNANNLSVVGSPSSIAGQISNSVALNGAPSYFTFANATAFDLAGSTSEISLLAWIKTTATDGIIFSLRNSGIPNTLIDFGVGRNNANVTLGAIASIIRDDGGFGLTNVTGGVVNDGNWHHVAYTRRSNGLNSVYIDASLSNSGTDAIAGGLTFNNTWSAIGVEASWLIGGVGTPAGVAVGAPFVGDIDDVQIYNRALSLTEITNIRNAGLGSGTLYSSGTIRVDQRQNKRLAHWKRGLDVDQAVVVLAPRTTDPITGTAFPDTIGSVPFIEAARGGALDGADIQIDRVFFASWPQPYTTPVTPVGAITIFAGTPAEVDTNDSQVILTVNDYRQLLQTKFPRVVFQMACVHTLFDTGCTLTPAGFSVAGIVCNASSTRQTLVASANVTPPTSPGSGTFTLGKITMTGGLNAGFSRTVRAWAAPRTFALLNPLPFTVAVGDTFTAIEGCDKKQTTCTAFNNLANFGGEPFIPDVTSAV